MTNIVVSKTQKKRIDERYHYIVACIEIISDSTLPKGNYRHFLKPYLDQNIKDLHAVMRQVRRFWIAEGRPRGNNYESYREYKETNSLFRTYHRNCSEKYSLQLNGEIEEAAEIDAAFFWKKINFRRKLSVSHAGNEIEFNGQVHCDPEDIANGWGCTFIKFTPIQKDRISTLPLCVKLTRIADIKHELQLIPDSASLSITT